MERRATSKQGLLPEKRNDEGWTAVVPGAVKTRAYTSVGPNWKNEETPLRSLRECMLRWRQVRADDIPLGMTSIPS